MEQPRRWPVTPKSRIFWDRTTVANVLGGVSIFVKVYACVCKILLRCGSWRIVVPGGFMSHVIVVVIVVVMKTWSCCRGSRGRVGC